MKLPDLTKVPLLFLTATLVSVAHADIYKCTDEHGNVAYLQTPCPVEKAEDASDAQAAMSGQRGERVADCKKRYRDQIDEIDAEMRTAFSPEQGPAYKERLLELTRQLRACE